MSLGGIATIIWFDLSIGQVNQKKFRGWMIRSSPPEDRPLVFSKDESKAKKSSLIIEEGNQTDLV